MTSIHATDSRLSAVRILVRLFRRILPSAIIAAVSTGLCLLALEGAARIYARFANHPRGMTFDPELGWRPLPSISKIGDGWGASHAAVTNSHGWRDAERIYQKRSHRIVAIGDSFTFGMDVDDGERFTDYLQRELDQVETVNLGVSGYGTDQELRLLETEAFKYEPDLIVLTVCILNDLEDIGYQRLYSMPKPYYSLEQGRLRLHKPQLTWDIRIRESSYLVEFFYQRLMNGAYKFEWAQGFTPANTVPVFQALIQEFVDVTAQHGARLVAVEAYAPEGSSGDSTERGRIVTSILQRAGVPFLDTRQLFSSISSDPDHLLYAADGVHWNAQGHAVVADALAKLLEQMNFGSHKS